MKILKEATTGKKAYYTQDSIGKVKYTVSFYDGEKTYQDGSPFYDIKTFKSKAERDKFVKDLVKDGYAKE